ncbi:heavy-metal-associated domain-containing protein [Lutibacter sp.]
MRKYISVLIVIFTFLSCNETKKENTIKNNEVQQEVAAVYKSLEVEIEGMTCEIGCARTIQSKLSKVDGVTYSKVNFEAKKGQFTYDENKITKEDIINKINGIAGGDLYKVTKSTDIERIIEEIN